ncbi:hypothetical protein BDV93DRAFT_564103 [Ceratobasidium sp. AG-I]|nr:hypothetical protein BDV93DRAFT_564103 [Ceratobasidium sp. AG-I]
MATAMLSRGLAASIHPSASGNPSASITASKTARHIMHFGTEWGTGSIFDDWYHKLRTSENSSTFIDKLEVRLTSGAIPHRFVVTYLQDGRVFRFDRRPETPDPATSAADDVCEVKTPADKLEIQGSYLEVALSLPPKTDILLVLSACYAVSQDKKASEYALLAYNCYFFAWTITMVVTRHVFPFNTPSPDDVQSRLSTRLDDVTQSITKKIVGALLSIVLDTITTFRTHTGRRLYRGLSKRELAVWGLPLPALRLLMRQCLKMRLHFGLEAKLKEQVHRELSQSISPVLAQVLQKQQDTTKHLVENKLWLDDLVDVFRLPIEGRILDILWDGILEAVSAGYGDVSGHDFLQTIGKENRLSYLKYRFFGRNVVQFSQIWNAALHAALPAAREKGRKQRLLGKDGKIDHAAMFNLAFKAGRDAALQAAQKIVAKTGPELNNKKRDEMWIIVWEAWEGVWNSSQENAEKMVVDLIESTIQEIVGWVATDVAGEFGTGKGREVQAVIKHKADKISSQGDSMSLGDFQQRMKNFIHSTPMQSAEQLESVETAMISAWEFSHKTYRSL